jgi:LacI family transcriptional regulator
MKRGPGVILLFTPAREFDRGLRRGILEYARTHGPWTIYDDGSACLDALSADDLIDCLARRNARGMIVPPGRAHELALLGIPMVITGGTRKPGAPGHQLLCADEAIGRMGATTLLGLGLRHFAYWDPADVEFSAAREQGFVEAINQTGHSAHCYRSTPAQLADWLRWLPKPAGVMACDDERASIVAEICRFQGIRVPDEIAILGVDNNCELCESASPPLASIALATERGGYEAAALLDALMRGVAPPSQTVIVPPTHVVPRESIDTIAIDDPAVAQALRFIRENANRDVRVSELLAATGMCRRSLQDHFRRYLSRTPMEEIHRCRVDRLTRLLVETNLTVREIAAVSGFELDAHVARFFSRHTGIGPLEFRKKTRTPGSFVRV